MIEDDGDDLIHWYHVDCNPAVALCGTDLVDGLLGYDGEGMECVVCAELMEVGDCNVTCPVVVFT